MLLNSEQIFMTKIILFNDVTSIPLENKLLNTMFELPPSGYHFLMAKSDLHVMLSWGNCCSKDTLCYVALNSFTPTFLACALPSLNLDRTIIRNRDLGQI